MSFIGHLICYTISSGASEEPLAVTRDQLRKLLVEAGIDTAYLPPEGRAINAFRTATSPVTDTYQRGDITVTLSIREVTGDDVVTRHVYATWRDHEGATKERRMANLQFFRPRRTAAGRVPGTERLRVLVDQRLKGIDRERTEALVARVKELYQINRDHLNAHALRAVVRAYLSNLGAVAVAGSTGGWYLVPPEKLTAVAAIRSVVRRCGDNCRMRVIPLPDDPDMRAMIVESVDADVAGRAAVIVREMGELLHGDPRAVPSTARWSAWRADCQILQDLLVAYGDRYASSFPAAAATLDQAVEMSTQLGRRLAAARGA